MLTVSQLQSVKMDDSGSVVRNMPPATVAVAATSAAPDLGLVVRRRAAGADEPPAGPFDPAGPPGEAGAARCWVPVISASPLGPTAAGATTRTGHCRTRQAPPASRRPAARPRSPART